MRNFDASVFPFDKYFLTFEIKKLPLKSWRNVFLKTSKKKTFTYRSLELNIVDKGLSNYKNWRQSAVQKHVLMFFQNLFFCKMLRTGAKKIRNKKNQVL